MATYSTGVLATTSITDFHLLILADSGRLITIRMYSQGGVVALRSTYLVS